MRKTYLVLVACRWCCRSREVDQKGVFIVANGLGVSTTRDAYQWPCREEAEFIFNVCCGTKPACSRHWEPYKYRVFLRY